MKNRYKKILLIAAALPAFAFAAGKPPVGSDALAARAEKLFLDDVDPGQPKLHLERLQQDEVMRLCSQYRDNPPPKVRKRIEAVSRQAIRYPVEGRLMGDWKKGEALASSGRGGHVGRIQPDAPGLQRGGNCYACHQLAKKEVAYGTIGPSLQQFGKVRGYSEEMQRYAYERIFNSQTFSACTNMPRFGYHQWLSPEEITHIVAFLMDPESPVNQE